MDELIGALAPTVNPRKGKKQKHHTQLRNDKEREMRATLVLARKLQGRTMAQIADEFNIAVSTGYKALSLARRGEFYEAARDSLMGLIPKSFAVIDKALTEGDVESAWKVLEANGLAGKNITIHADTGGGATETFSEYRLRVLQRTSPHAPAHQESLERGGVQSGSQLDLPILDADSSSFPDAPEGPHHPHHEDLHTGARG